MAVGLRDCVRTCAKIEVRQCEVWARWDDGNEMLIAEFRAADDALKFANTVLGLLLTPRAKKHAQKRARQESEFKEWLASTLRGLRLEGAR